MPVLSRMRVLCALATCAAGVAVAVPMKFAGGSLARFLPESAVFFPSAAVGAAVAGLIFASGFGREGWIGRLFGALSAVGATVLGGAIGAFFALGVYGQHQGVPLAV